MRFDGIHQSRIDAAESAYGLTDDERGKKRRAEGLRRRKKSVKRGLSMRMSRIQMGGL